MSRQSRNERRARARFFHQTHTSAANADRHIWRTRKVTRRDATGGNWGHLSRGAGSVPQLLMVAVQQESEKVSGDDEDDKMREGFSPGSDRVLRRGRGGRDL